jgi:hypothetical protein
MHLSIPGQNGIGRGLCRAWDYRNRDLKPLAGRTSGCAKALVRSERQAADSEDRGLAQALDERFSGCPTHNVRIPVILITDSGGSRSSNPSLLVRALVVGIVLLAPGVIGAR